MATTRFTPPKSPMVNGKHHSGCMWGLYSLFDFRQADSGRKLISDRKRSNKDLAIENGSAEPSYLVPELDHIKGRGKNRNKHKKEETELGRKPSQRLNPRPNVAEKYLEKNDKKAKKKKKKGCGCKNVDFVRYDELSKVDDAAEAIVNQKLSCGDGANPRSRQLLDALDILNSNKELFAKLLQDPDSLLVKHIQELRDSQDRKLDSERESEIVVLKPGPMSGQRASSSSSSSLVKSDFGFGDMKRKLRHAMGAARKDPSLTMTRESRGAEEVKRKFRNRNDAEKFSCYDAQRSDKIEKLRDFKARIGQEMAKQALRQSPEDEFSPFRNPGRDANARFSSPYSYAQVAYDDWRLAKGHKRASYAGSLKENIEALIDSNKKRSNSSTIVKSVSEEACETSNVTCHEEARLFEEPCATNRSSEATDVANNEETEDSASSRLDSCLEDQSSTCSSNVFPSTPSTINRSDDRDGSKDIGESSPVSVLEQYFADPCQPEEDRSSETNLAKPHSDTETIGSAHAHAHGRISEYVKALLQASGSESRECCQSEKLFRANSHPRSSKLCGDCKLIFDCVSEVLVELHEARFTHSPWLSFVAPKTTVLRPLSVEKFATREAVKRVESFFSTSPRSSAERSMEWLIGNDLRRSGAWMDLRSDAEGVVVEIAEDALDDLIMEFVDDLYI